MRQTLTVRFHRAVKLGMLACVRLLQGFTVFRLLGAWLLKAGMGKRIGSGLTHPLYFASKAVQLCRGTGIEIGSLHRRLPLAANVLYLDMCTTTQLRSQYADDPRVDEIGQEIYDLVLEAAAGRQTCSEAMGHAEFILTYKSFEPIGPACLPA